MPSQQGELPAGVFEQQVDASNLDASFSNRAFAWSARANATYKVTPSLDAQAFVMYRAPQKIEQGTMSRFTMANVAALKVPLEVNVSAGENWAAAK